MFFSNAVLKGNTSFKEALALTRERLELLTNDSANKMTPGYKAQGVQFNMFLSQTNNKNFPENNKKNIARSLSSASISNSSNRVDGNNVDYEATLMATKETETHYVVLANVLGKNLSNIKEHIREIK